jgi:hypothetical protein
MALSGAAQAQTTLFSDNFGTSRGSAYTVAAGAIGTDSNWLLARSGVDFGAKIDGGILDLSNDGSASGNVNGWAFGYRDINALSGWSTTLSSNTGKVTWEFNMRQIRSDPAGFAAGSYGVAFVVAGTSATAATVGSGYAVTLGQSGATDAVRLVSFNNGLQGTQTLILASNTTGLTDFGADYLSVRVTYTPSSNTWELFVRNDGTSAFADPATGSLTSQGTAINNLYTSTSGMRYIGGYWSGSTAANQTAFFDNIYFKQEVSSAPSIGTTGTLSAFTTTAGTASAAQTFSVTGTNLTANITVTAPTDFEVASDGATYGGTATITQSGGSASGIVSVRIKASALKGAKSGNITLASTGATNVNVAVTGTVTGAETLPFGPQNFETDSFPFTQLTIQGSASWTRTASTLGAGVTTNATNTSMQINGLNSTPTNAHAWLILGPLDCSAATNPVLQFTTLTRFAFSGNFPAGVNELKLKVSSNYTGSGNPTNNGSWSDLAFIPPQNDLIKQSSGPVKLTGTAGQSNVYVAFEYQAAGITTGTALWQVDDVQVTEPAKLGMTLAINRGTIQEDAMYYDATPGVEGWYGYAIGTVYLPEPAGAGGKTVDLSLNDNSELGFYVSAEPTGIVTASSIQVTVLENESSALFYLIPKQDYGVDGNVPVTFTASVGDAAFDSGTAAITVNDADYPSISLTSSGYGADFSNFAGAASLPAGWTLVATSTNYTVWGDTSTGPKFASIGNLVFGYQHTGSTGIVKQVLTLKNDTGSVLNDLTIRYNGRVTNTTQGRDPFYALTVNGKAAPTLAYSTADGNLAARGASVTGLNVPTNGTVTIIWQSDGNNAPGSGSRKQIGISDVQVTLGVTQFAPTVSTLAWSQASLNQSSVAVSANLVGDGGATIDEKGFVYSRTADNANPILGGANVQTVTVPGTTAGTFQATLSGLTASTGYTVKAYAKNSVGTTYTAVSTFTTLDPTPLFGGYYSQGFSGFAGTLPEGWKGASSVSGVTSFLGDFGSGSSAGYRGPATGAVRGVLGYQHTTSSGTLTVSLTLQNNTAAAITNLNVAYLGRVGREAEATVLRMPEWAVSFISGTNTSNVTSLTYSTTNGVAERKTAALTNLNIGTNEVFSLVWSCAAPTTGSGASRQIGISDLVVSTSAITAPPVVTGGASLAGKVGEAILPYQVVADGSPTGYAASGLPAGLSVNPVTGELSGTPTAATSDVGAIVTIAASNAGGTGTATITVTIAKGDSTLQVTGASTYAYNGTAQGPDTISKTGSAATATFSYAGSGSTVYGPSATKPTAVGSYTATASVVADANYNGVTSAEFAFSISKGIPTITAAPTATAIDQGQALSASILSGGTASVAGTFGWTDGSVVPSGSGSYSVTFTPTDLANYNTASTSVNVTVNPVEGFNLNTWLAGETMSPAVLAKLAIGGASSAIADDGEKPVVTVDSNKLSLSAIVRTSGPAGLVVVGEAGNSLTNWATNGITVTASTNTNGVPTGHQRQEFSIDRSNSPTKQFLRLKATLQP